MGFTEEQKAALQKRLTKSDTATRTQAGRTLTYLEGFAAINHANECFGFDGWSHTIDRMDYNEALHFYTAVVTVSVHDGDGTLLGRHQDIGHGIVAIGQKGESAEAHETAAKGAVTDAMKRALRCWGTRFGNDLYDRDGLPPDDDRTAALRDEVRTLIANDRSAEANLPVPVDKQTHEQLAKTKAWLEKRAKKDEAES